MVSLAHLPLPTAEACGLQMVQPCSREEGREREKGREDWDLGNLCSLPILPNTGGAGRDLLYMFQASGLELLILNRSQRQFCKLIY